MNWRDQEEPGLVRAAQQGDAEAFTELVRRHQAALRALAAMAMLGPDDVADVVQEAFIAAYRHLADVDPDRPLGPWLRTICRNQVRNFIRDRMARHRRERPGQADAAIVDPDSDVPEDAERRLAALRACLARLDERKRQMLTRRFLDGAAVKDIAASLGISANNVSVQISQVKTVLLRCMAGSGQTEVS